MCISILIHKYMCLSNLYQGLYIFEYENNCNRTAVYMYQYCNPALINLTGMKELSPPSVNLKRLLETETLPSEPILIIISPGADPSQELQELAEQTIGSDKYHQVC